MRSLERKDSTSTEISGSSINDSRVTHGLGQDLRPYVLIVFPRVEERGSRVCRVTLSVYNCFIGVCTKKLIFTSFHETFSLDRNTLIYTFLRLDLSLSNGLLHYEPDS